MRTGKVCESLQDILASLPPNCEFQVDDVEDEWAHEEPFDYVHVRYMCASVGDFPTLIRAIFDNLTPGGFLEFQDCQYSLPPNDVFRSLLQNITLGISKPPSIEQLLT